MASQLQKGGRLGGSRVKTSIWSSEVKSGCWAVCKGDGCWLWSPFFPPLLEELGAEEGSLVYRQWGWHFPSSTLSRPHGLRCIILFYPWLSYELEVVPILQMKKARLREFKEGIWTGGRCEPVSFWPSHQGLFTLPQCLGELGLKVVAASGLGAEWRTKDVRSHMMREWWLLWN